MTTKKPNIHIRHYRQIQGDSKEGFKRGSQDVGITKYRDAFLGGIMQKEARIDLPFLSILSFFPSSSLSHLLIICQPKEGGVLKLAFAGYDPSAVR